MLRALLVSFALALPVVGCAAAPAAGPPIAREASLVFADARRLERTGQLDEIDGRDAARAAAERALALAPDWVAPRRFLDELDRTELRAPERLARYESTLARDDEDARTLYLAGRLRGPEGRRMFERATRLAPDLGWAWHGRGWLAFQAGATDRAEAHGRRALALARDPVEVAVFGDVLSRYLVADDREAEAIELLDELRARLGDHGEAHALEVRQALLELGAGRELVRARGERRAIALVRSGRAVPAEWPGLLAAVRGRGHDASAELRLAWLERHARGDGVSPELLVSGAPTALERALGGRASLRLELAQGDAAGAIEAWCRALPSSLRDEAGLPRAPRLAALVRAARTYGSSPDDARAAAARDLGDALVEAGWFDAAAAWAGRLPTGDRADSIALLARAEAGRLALRRVASLVRDLDAGNARGFVPLELDADVPRVEDLDDLLAALAGPLGLALGAFEPEAVEELAETLVGSPRIGYGFAGEVVHPGPRFSAEDERLGRGAAGRPVGGLAAALGRLGRFGLFGDAFGAPPDGALLRELWTAERRGEHLGVPFAGTVVWCDGADVPARAGRRGAAIAGAALHEGYWVDLAPLREERARWVALADRFAGAGGDARVAAAIAVAPLPCPRAERAETTLLLGAADRLRLVLMRERAGGDGLEPLPLDAFVRATEVHEEGHLCDRTRFYPVGDRWPALLGFLARNGFSPGLVARRFEERAQLVALCALDDPRLPLVDLLQAAESNGEGLTPHAAAYTVLAGEFLEELDRRLEAEPERWPELDPDARLGHQVHRLAPERVREVALALAERRGLIGM